MDATRKIEEFPPLPRCHVVGGHYPNHTDTIAGYSVEQLREYARVHAAQTLASKEAEIARLQAESELRHRLLQLHHADAMQLWAALNDLSFGCFGGIGTTRPSAEVYNVTFAVMQQHREAYSAEARNNPARAALTQPTE